MKETKTKKKEVEQEKEESQFGSSVICVSDILLLFPPCSWTFVCHLLYFFEVQVSLIFMSNKWWYHVCGDNESKGKASPYIWICERQFRHSAQLIFVLARTASLHAFLLLPQNCFYLGINPPVFKYLTLTFLAFEIQARLFEHLFLV